MMAWADRIPPVFVVEATLHPDTEGTRVLDQFVRARVAPPLVTGD